MKEKEPLRSGENVWIHDYNTNGTINDEMTYRSSDVMIPTGSVIRRNQRDIVSNPQENSLIIDEVPLEDPTGDEIIQTETNNVPIAINCNVKDNVTRSGRISQPRV